MVLAGSGPGSPLSASLKRMNDKLQGQGGDDDGMDELYETPKNKEASVDEQEREEMNMSAAVPLKVLQGKHPDAPKEGDEIVVKIKSVDGDMAMIEYSETPPSEIGEGEGYGEKGPADETADEELDRMGKEY